MKRLKQSWKQIAAIATATITMIILLKTVFLIGYVPSESMEPTLPKGSFVVGYRLCSEFKAGDIIIFSHANKLLVKRIAAVEGDSVVNGGVKQLVPEGNFYVVGDNLDNSYDSRYWENPFVDRKEIVARVMLKINKNKN